MTEMNQYLLVNNNSQNELSQFFNEKSQIRRLDQEIKFNKMLYTRNILKTKKSQIKN